MKITNRLQNVLPLPRLGSLFSGLSVSRLLFMSLVMCRMFFLHGMHVWAKDTTTLSSDHVRNAAHPISTVPDEVWRLVRSVSSGCGRKGRHVSFDGLQGIVHNIFQRSFRRATRKHSYSGVLHLYVARNGHDTTVGQEPMRWRCARASSASTLARLPSPRIATAHWHTLACRRGGTRLAEGPPPRRNLRDRGNEDLYNHQRL